MPGRPCQICSDTANLPIAAEMIASGASDQAIADKIGRISRMSVARHGRNCIERPMKAIVAAANKDKNLRDERDQLIAAAETGGVTAAFLSLERIAMDLRRVQERLEHTANAAETDGQRLAVASLSGQQLRAAEVRAKLGGWVTSQSDKGNAATINFSGRRTTRIEGVPMHPEDPAFNALPAVPLSIGADHSVGGSAACVTEEQDDEAEFDEDV